MRKQITQEHSRRLLVILPVLLASLFVLPATAGADATPAAENTFSSAPGLPDGRVWEQVSPANKNGNEAGAVLEYDLTSDKYGDERYGFAAADGDSVLFEGNGPIGEDDEPNASYFVASKNPLAAGWSTRTIAPRSSTKTRGPAVELLRDVDPSADLSHTTFLGETGQYATDMPSKCVEQMYLGGSDPFAPAAWLERPGIADPIASCSGRGAVAGGTPDFSTVYFTSPDTLLAADAPRAPYAQPKEAGDTDVEAWGFYEYAEGALREAGVLPDGLPDPFGAVPADSGHGKALEGNQVSADGSRAFFVSPDPGAVGSCETVEEGKGESSAQAAAACAPQLYVRENGTRTALLSRDTLLPEAGGLPAAAPDGVLGTEEEVKSHVEESHDGYVFASPDGSQAFFQSEDRLTSAAPDKAAGDEAKVTGGVRGGTFTLTVTADADSQTTAPIAYDATAADIRSTLEALSDVGVGNVTVGGGPGFPFTVTIGAGVENVTMTIDSSKLEIKSRGSVALQNQPLAKTYDFDLDTGSLTYLPGVVGRLVATDTNGTSLAFVNSAVSPPELDLWSAGPAGGSVTPVTRLPSAPSCGGGPGLNFGEAPSQYVCEARISSDGTVLVFTAAGIPGFNDGGSHSDEIGQTVPDLQIFRYDSSTNTLGCVSCPPHGISPTGDAVMSPPQSTAEEAGYPPRGAVDVRGISADGSRVFFDTPDPLVPQDTNTGSTVREIQGNYIPAGRDVYEWENGVVYLISSGKSPDNSYVLDNGENGDDVFFATSEGLVPGDTDGAYDVYDARVPQPGDNPPPAAVPCEGSVCQGPPHVPSPLTPPASATFSGLGNPTLEPAAAPPVKKTTAKTVKCKKNYVKKKGKCVKKAKAKKAKKASSDRRSK